MLGRMVAQAVDSSGGAFPEVIVDFEYAQGLLFIVIENIGAAPAYGVTVVFDQEIKGVGGDSVVSELNVFKALQFLPPSKKIRVFLDTLDSYILRGQPLRINVTVNYRGKDGRSFTDQIMHDLSIYKGITEV